MSSGEKAHDRCRQPDITQCPLSAWVGALASLGMFPPPPLKFRTVGFPQYGFKLDISHGDLRQRAALPLAQDPHRHCDTTDLYAITRPPLAPLWSFRTSCRGPLPGRLQSSGPWLTSRLCCPTRSSLTMAASESLGHFRRFMDSYNGSSPVSLIQGRPEMFPNLLCLSFPPCRLPYPVGPGRCS